MPWRLRHRRPRRDLTRSRERRSSTTSPQLASPVLGLAASAHVFAGLPRFAKNPCKSAAFRGMPAFFVASVRSGPAVSCAPLPEPPTLWLPSRAWAKGLSLPERRKPEITVPICLFGAGHWNQDDSTASASAFPSPGTAHRPRRRKYRWRSRPCGRADH